MNDVGLSGLELRVLAFEHRRWLYEGSGEEPITVVDLSPARSHQLLAWTVVGPDDKAGHAYPAGPPLCRLRLCIGSK